MQEQLEMVRVCESKEHLLNEDDIIFVAEVGDILESGDILDEKQASRLDSIWNKTIISPKDKSSNRRACPD